MLINLLLFILLLLDCIQSSKEALLSEGANEDWYDALTTPSIDCDDSPRTNILEQISVDLKMAILEFLPRNALYSLMRCNQNNLYFCNAFIRQLISIKFAHLLNHRDSEINLNHLLQIPFVEPITMNTSDMSLYFGNRQNETSSKYIGLDAVTKNGFIAFWMKTIEIKPQCDIIAIVFNHTAVHSIYSSDPFDLFPLNNSLLALPINDSCESSIIRTINTVLLTGKVTDVSDVGIVWCLNDQYKECIFWPRIKEKMGCPATLILCLLIFLTVLMLVLAFIAQLRH